MNLADALLLPQDDLALAVALKSPLFGLNDDDLFTLAWDRKGSLRDALAAHAAGRRAGSRTRSTGSNNASAASVTETPFAFYAWLLGGDGGRARILRRLGHEANDALDEFLELALNYERKAPASLQGFMAWLRAADTEVKRDMEISRDEVRVMTVHGAKGLEASVCSGRHHDVAVGYAAAAADPSAAGQWRQGRGLGRTQGRRSARRGRRARGDAGRDRGRISPPALCRDDARRRPADRRRLHARQHGAASATFLVRSDRQGSREFRTAASGDRDPNGVGEALLARRRTATAAAERRRRAGHDSADRAAGLAADISAVGSVRRQPVAPLRSRRRRRPSGADRRIDPAARPRAAARHAGAPAAAIAARYRARAPPRSRAVVSRPQRRRLDRRRAQALAEGAWP